MGDRIGTAVDGTLYHVPVTEFSRVAGLNASAPERSRIFATLCRLNVLYMIARAGSGHIGSSFSCLDVLAWLFLNELGPQTDSMSATPHDIFFSSKGHDVPALYAVLIGLGRLDAGLLHRLRQLGGLPGHPDVRTPHIETNTGSLGMGISKAKGMIFAYRRRSEPCRVFVMTGDGELQEGQIWESLISAANQDLGELTVIVDHNKLQSDTLVDRTSPLGDMEAKFAGFGWSVARCDGHDPDDFAATLRALSAIGTRPKVIIADTVKGCGVSFMAHTAMAAEADLYAFHSGAPDRATYHAAVQELIDAANGLLAEVDAGALELEVGEAGTAGTRSTSGGTPQRLIDAYGRSLVRQAAANRSLVALDADLALDTGLIPFRERFRARYLQCGIAEQDMVSQAGGMALKGLLPVVHSFACFLSARANEQIYNNATEGSKILYVGSLAGVIPGGPGHSHQAVRDVSVLAAVPGLVIVEPALEAEVEAAVDYMVNGSSDSTYLRLTSVPWEVPFTAPTDHRLEHGRGWTVTDGADAVLISYGPIMLSEAFQAAGLLRARHDIGLKVINLPWLNRLDADWLVQTIGDIGAVFTLDNHFVTGGQGDAICGVVATKGLRVTVTKLGLTGIPVCGTARDVLDAHGLDRESLVQVIADAAGTSRGV